MINKVSWKYIFNYCHQDLSGKLLPFNTSSSLEEINTNESILKKKKQANCNLCVYGSIEDLLVAAALEKMLPMDFNKENWFFGHKKSLFKLTFSFRVNGRCWIDVAFLFQPGQKLKKMSPFCDVSDAMFLAINERSKRTEPLCFRKSLLTNPPYNTTQIPPYWERRKQNISPLFSILEASRITGHWPWLTHPKKKNLDWSRDRDFGLYAK